MNSELIDLFSSPASARHFGTRHGPARLVDEETMHEGLIVYMENGDVLEQGGHRELMARRVPGAADGAGFGSCVTQSSDGDQLI